MAAQASQRLHLTRVEGPARAGREATEPQRPELDAAEARHAMPERLAVAAHFAVASFRERDGKAARPRPALPEPDLGRDAGTVGEHGAAAPARQVGVPDAPLHRRLVHAPDL